MKGGNPDDTIVSLVCLGGGWRGGDADGQLIGLEM